MIKEYFEFIGKDVPSPEASEKVRGIFKFPSDYYMDEMLHLELLISKIDSIDVRCIDFSDLLRLNGVVDIFKIPELPYVMVCATNEKDLNNAAKIAEHQINICENKLKFEQNEHRETFNSHDLKLLNNPVSVENTYSTNSVFSPYLEPEGGIAYIENMVLTVIYPGINPHKEHIEIAELLKIPKDSVKVICPSSRAAYGGKGVIPIHLYLAIGAYKTGKPVKLVLNSEQTKYTGYSFPMTLETKTGISSDLSSLGNDIKISIDTGSSNTLDETVIERIKAAFSGTYNTSHCNIELLIKNSENHFSDSFPGEGYLQSVFAIETQLDIHSRNTSIDPIDLRIKLISENEKTESLAYKKLLQSMKDSDLYRNASLYKRSKDPYIKKGIGIAACMVPVTFKSNFKGENLPAVRIFINEQKRYQIELSCPDSGKGANAVFAQFAAEVIGCGIDKIKISNGASNLPYPGHLSRGGTAHIAGEYVKKAAEDLKEKLSMNGVTPEAFKRPSSIPGKLLSLAGTAFHQAIEESYSGIGHVVLLEVNTRFCTVEINKMENFICAGTIINPQTLTGAINGAIARSIKYSFGIRNYPRINEMPVEIVNHFIDTHDTKDKAFGARSAGEILGVALTPSLFNAFYDATSKRTISLPLTPNRIHSLIYGEQNGEQI